jgi:type IX secretion system PorP/SprF family membrane protein
MKHIFKHILFLVLISFAMPSISVAQDARFSQFYNSPLNLNPAMIGVYNGGHRVVVNYRDQWNSFLAPEPFRTYSVSYDMRKNVNRDDYIAFGVSAMHDEAGTSLFNQNRGNLGLSFIKQLSGGRNTADHYLTAGAQFGAGQNSIDVNRLWFSNQFDNGTETPNTSISNGESNIQANTNVYVDFNAGLSWYVLFDNEGFIYAGGAMNHINRPNISLMNNNNERLYSRWLGHAGGLIPMTDNFGLMPALQLMKQGPSFESDLAMNVRYTNHDRNELGLRAGLSTRIANRLNKGVHMEALTVLAMVEIQRWTVGISYDVTTSTLTRANNSRGAFEVSAIYIHPEHRRSKVKCPKM